MRICTWCFQSLLLSVVIVHLHGVDMDIQLAWNQWEGTLLERNPVDTLDGGGYIDSILPVMKYIAQADDSDAMEAGNLSTALKERLIVIAKEISADDRQYKELMQAYRVVDFKRAVAIPPRLRKEHLTESYRAEWELISLQPYTLDRRRMSKRIPEALRSIGNEETLIVFRYAFEVIIQEGVKHLAVSNLGDNLRISGRNKVNNRCHQMLGYMQGDSKVTVMNLTKRRYI